MRMKRQCFSRSSARKVGQRLIALSPHCFEHCPLPCHVLFGRPSKLPSLRVRPVSRLSDPRDNSLYRDLELDAASASSVTVVVSEVSTCGIVSPLPDSTSNDARPLGRPSASRYSKSSQLAGVMKYQSLSLLMRTSASNPLPHHSPTYA